MTEIKLTKRYPHSRTEDIVDAYMRGWNDALDAVQNGKFHIADRKDEPSTYKKWTPKPTAEVPKVNTNCVGVMASVFEDEPEITSTNEGNDVWEYRGGEWHKVEDEPQTERSE